MMNSMSLPTSGIRSIQRNRRGPMSRQRSSRAKSFSNKQNRYTKQPVDKDDRENLIDTTLEMNGGSTFQRRNKKGSRNMHVPKRENDYSYVSGDRSYTSYDDRSVATFPSAFAIFEVPFFLRKREWIWHMFLMAVGVVLYLFFYTLGTSVQRRSTRMKIDDFVPSQSQFIGTADGGIKSTNSVSPSEVINSKDKPVLNIDLDSNDDMVMSDTMGSLRGYNKMRVPISMEEINDDRVEFRGENDAATIRGQPVIDQEFHLEKSNKAEIPNQTQDDPDGKIEETQQVIEAKAIEQKATVDVKNNVSAETAQSTSDKVIENGNNVDVQIDLQEESSTSNLVESTNINQKSTTQDKTGLDVGSEATTIKHNEILPSADLESSENLTFIEKEVSATTEQTHDAAKKKSDDLDFKVEPSSQSVMEDTTKNTIMAGNAPLSQNLAKVGDSVSVDNPVNGAIVSTESLSDVLSDASTSLQNIDTAASDITSVKNTNTTASDVSTPIQNNDNPAPDAVISTDTAIPDVIISNQSTITAIASQQNPVADATTSNQRPEAEVFNLRDPVQSKDSSAASASAPSTDTVAAQRTDAVVSEAITPVQTTAKKEESLSDHPTSMKE